MRTTEHLKEYQLKPWILKLGDKDLMRDMIKSGIGLDSFMEFWHKAGLTLSSARVYYYRIKKAIDNS